MKKRDNYGWHDLRKDPNDLPEIEATEMISGIPFKRSETVLAYDGEAYMFELILRPEDEENGFDADVIAWKYIEPFEG